MPAPTTTPCAGIIAKSHMAAWNVIRFSGTLPVLIFPMARSGRYTPVRNQNGPKRRDSFKKNNFPGNMLDRFGDLTTICLF
jgi:hypothetical protein